MHDGEIHDHILNLLRDDCFRITPTDLKRRIRKAFPHTNAKDFRSALRKLLSAGEVVYTNHFNTTHVELGHHRPLHISNRIVLAPFDCSPPNAQGDTVIKLNDGTAFGGGDHPTSRMMLQGIDYIMEVFPYKVPEAGAIVLDIGTGTGILAVACACLGVSRVVAVDIDPVACLEARQNARLNNVQDRVIVTDDIYRHAPENGYTTILANLRPPSLKQLFPQMLNLSANTSFWILSGFRAKASGFIDEGLRDIDCTLFWEAESCGWGAIALELKK